MVIRRGDVCWVDFGTPRGSEPAKRRPAVVLQDNWLLDSKINTILVLPFTSNVRQSAFPGNVFVPAVVSGLPVDSVAVVAQAGPVSREFLEPFPVSSLPASIMMSIDDGVKLVLGL